MVFVCLLITNLRYLINVNTAVIDCCNSLEISFTFNAINYIVTSVYRSPNNDVNLFLNSLYDYLSVNLNNNYHIFGGILYIDLFSSNLSVTNYLNYFKSICLLLMY